MKITRAQLKRLIREELEGMPESTGIPAKEIPWEPVERPIFSGARAEVMLVPNTDGISHRVVGTEDALRAWAEEIDEDSMFAQDEQIPGRWDAVAGPAYEKAEKEARYISRYM